MDLNATLWGQVFFVLALIVIFFTVKFAKGKASNVPLVGLYAILLNFIFPPAGWVYCGYWFFKKDAIANF